jgi:hypothetical protein
LPIQIHRALLLGKGHEHHRRTVHRIDNHIANINAESKSDIADIKEQLKL